MTLEFSPIMAAYLVAGILLIDIAVFIDVRRRRLPVWLILLPIVFGPPGGMAYFIARPPMSGE